MYIIHDEILLSFLSKLLLFVSNPLLSSSFQIFPNVEQQIRTHLQSVIHAYKEILRMFNMLLITQMIE
jgi:hypothetical protein